PHGTALSSLVDADDEVAVVVTDVTRATPDDALLAAMGERLPVQRDQISVVLGLGLHRPMTDEEIRAGLGEFADLAENHDPDATVEVGRVDDVPIRLNETVADADTVLATGMVEPHQYAGFSGGAKTVVIGAGGEPIIRYTHGPEMLAEPGVRLGRIDDNPFRETVDRAGDLAGLDFSLNVTHGPAGILGAAAGDPRSVVADLAGRGRDALSVPVETDYDAVIAGVGAPKDANLYQTTRAATYVILGARNPLRSGGRVVVPARLPEGVGEGAGERRFGERLRSADSAEELYETMREGYEPGAQRAFVTARALRDHEVWITNSDCPETVESCLLSAAERPEQAVEPGSDVLVVPDALNTLLVPA
ncbi:MAG: lactate racemase domain-containing protein, partial [Halobaculum sp.]